MLRDGYGWRLCFIGFVCEPWIYFRDRHSLAELRQGLSRPKDQQVGDEPLSVYHARTGSKIHGLAHRENDSWTLEDTIMGGHSDGRHWIGQRIDEHLQSAPELCALRWRPVVARRWLESVSPQSILAVPSLGRHLLSGHEPYTVSILENDLEARAHFKSLHPGCIVLQSDWDQLCDERYDAVVMVGMAEHMGDSELRRTLSTLRQCLGHQGHLILITLAAPPRTDWASMCIGSALRFRPMEQLRGHLETCGFRILEHEVDPYRSQLGVLCSATEFTV